MSGIRMIRNMANRHMVIRRMASFRVAPFLLVALLALPTLGGCSWNTTTPIPEWQTQQGEAFRAQREAQTLNPGHADDDPVLGADGRVAERAMKTWREGDKKAEPGQSMQLKIGNK